MKNKFIIVLMFTIFALQGFAQPDNPFDYEKFKAKKIAYITEAINLTPAEAEKFWPVYNEFEQKKFALMIERHKMELMLDKNSENLNDEKYIELSRKFSAQQSLEGDLFKEYNEKFLKLLPPKKVVRLYVAEMNFKGFLLKEYKRGDDGPRFNR
ncbi:MAG: hypothetical protein GXX78_00980 [Bacteroidales bacterium]|nr:hypothetical protein [Bacteroidales bacterium]